MTTERTPALSTPDADAEWRGCSFLAAPPEHRAVRRTQSLRRTALSPAPGHQSPRTKASPASRATSLARPAADMRATPADYRRCSRHTGNRDRALPHARHRRTSVAAGVRSPKWRTPGDRLPPPGGAAATAPAMRRATAHGCQDRAAAPEPRPATPRRHGPGSATSAATDASVRGHRRNREAAPPGRIPGTCSTPPANHRGAAAPSWPPSARPGTSAPR